MRPRPPTPALEFVGKGASGQGRRGNAENVAAGRHPPQRAFNRCDVRRSGKADSATGFGHGNPGIEEIFAQPKTERFGGKDRRETEISNRGRMLASHERRCFIIRGLLSNGTLSEPSCIEARTSSYLTKGNFGLVGGPDGRHYR
jgi:hypothetical protein